MRSGAPGQRGGAGRGGRGRGQVNISARPVELPAGALRTERVTFLSGPTENAGVTDGADVAEGQPEAGRWSSDAADRDEPETGGANLDGAEPNSAGLLA